LKRYGAHQNPPSALDEAALGCGLRILRRRDADLARILENFGPPPLWAREPGFPTLVHMILEQQVSLASARAAYNRLLERVTPLTPAGFLQLDATELRAIGFSRQKAGYCRLLAESVRDNQLNLDAVAAMDDLAARGELLRIKGVGHWTADIYLLMALRRPDVWPKGDLALAKAMQRLKRLRSHPSPERIEQLSASWRPWRAVAARILWHDYLSRLAAARNGRK
jgi:DNA-3-methyladenine glycosylase II